MATPGLYRRKLPSPPAIDFASPDGKKLFTEAIHNGTMEGFFKLISNFQTQSEPAYCGLATLAMVLNALAIDPCRKWKGPWRWYDESMLDCCEPLEKIKARGISFGKVVCLAHCAGAKVESFRTNQSSIDEFRKYVVACTTSEDYHLISSYHRGAFQQTGSGHFSPIGGYHAESDMVLILDVARFKYPPHWVPLQLLWEAMDTVDQSTNLHRGFMLVSIRNKAPPLLCTLSCKHESWIRTAKYLTNDLPVMLSSDNLKNIKDVLSTILFSMPSDFTEFITEGLKEEDGGQEEIGTVDSKNEVLKLVRETNLYKHVCDANNIRPGPEIVASSNIEQGVDVLTAFLLALPPQTWSFIKDVHVSQKIFPLVSIEDLPTLLQEEILYLRDQLLLLKRCKDSWIEDYPKTG